MTVNTATPRVHHRPRRDWANVALFGWGIVVFIFLFLPILMIFIFSFNTGRILTDWNGFGFEGYQSFFSNPAPRSAVQVSLIVAALSAVLATVLGSLAGVALARRPGKWAALFLFVVALVLVTPEIVDAVRCCPGTGAWPRHESDLLQQWLCTPHCESRDI